MFVDLVGSTALSTRLDPEEMREVIQRLPDTRSPREIARFEGHVAKFMGDGVLAYFGWPRAHEDEAERAVRAGLAVTAAVARLTAPGGEPLAARVGIATGLVVVGDLVGEGAAQEEAVVGETPNLAARLQALAEPGTVVVAASTRRLLGRLFEFADLGAHRAARASPSPVAAFRVAARARGREPVRGAARAAPDAAGRARARARPAARPLAAGPGRRRARSCCSSGEPGIGKSRLLQSLRDRRRRRAAYAAALLLLALSIRTPPSTRSSTRSSAPPASTATIRPATSCDKLEALFALSGRPTAEATALTAALLGIADRWPLRAGLGTRRRRGARPSCRRSGSSSWSAWPAGGPC